MQTITATAARSRWFEVMKKAVDAHRQFRVLSKRGGVIVMSEDDYESLLETLELLSTPSVLKGVRKAKQDIKKGRVYSLKEIFGE